MLAQILHARGLREQLINLFRRRQLVSALEIPASQFLLDSRQHLQCSRILHLFRFGGCLLRVQDAAGQGFEDGGAPVTRGVGGRQCHLSGFESRRVSGANVFDDGLAAFGGEGGAGRGFAGAETPV